MQLRPLQYRLDYLQSNLNQVNANSASSVNFPQCPYVRTFGNVGLSQIFEVESNAFDERTLWRESKMKIHLTSDFEWWFSAPCDTAEMNAVSLE